MNNHVGCLSTTTGGVAYQFRCVPSMSCMGTRPRWSGPSISIRSTLLCVATPRLCVTIDVVCLCQPFASTRTFVRSFIVTSTVNNHPLKSMNYHKYIIQIPCYRLVTAGVVPSASPGPVNRPTRGAETWTKSSAKRLQWVSDQFKEGSNLDWVQNGSKMGPKWHSGQLEVDLCPGWVQNWSETYLQVIQNGFRTSSK